jgi:hypothetical protein
VESFGSVSQTGLRLSVSRASKHRTPQAADVASTAAG